MDRVRADLVGDPQLANVVPRWEHVGRDRRQAEQDDSTDIIASLEVALWY